MKNALQLILVAIVGVGVGVLVRAVAQGGPAPHPAAFASHLTFEEALTEGQAAQKPVVVVAGASWCGPCQALKRSTLSDERIESWLIENSVPVYVDVDEQPTAAAQLGVVGIPLTTVIMNGRAVAQLSGFRGPDEYMSWLEAAKAQAEALAAELSQPTELSSAG